MQLSMDPQQEMAELRITVRRGREGRNLAVYVVVADDRGSILKRWAKKGTKPRDESGLPDFLKAVAYAYMWGRPGDVEMAAAYHWLSDLPMLPAHLA